MALGLGRMFGIRLPLNFDSPYKATSLIEFWRRWHMTLTRLLTSYVYSPLALEAARARLRHGLPTSGASALLSLTLVPTLLTMLLVGIWHGAGYQFVAFGLLHGVFLCVNHLWREFKRGRDAVLGRVPARLRRATARVATLAAVTFAFVFFRADSLDAALRIAGGMLGGNGVVLPPRYLGLLGWLGPLAEQLGMRAGRDTFQGGWQVLWIAAALGIAWLAPNTQQIFARYLDAHAPQVAFRYRVAPSASRAARWRPNLGWALLAAAAGAFCVLRMHYSSEFLYFGF
jgi:alginate O-acetyltransferase complex protein AlgI